VKPLRAPPHQVLVSVRSSGRPTRSRPSVPVVSPLAPPSPKGAAVSIQHGAKGDGKLVIRYGSLDELDGILAHIR